MIRHPRTLGRLGHARSAAVHALAAARPRAAPQGLAGLHVRLQARAVQLVLPARAASARTSSSSPTRSRSRRATPSTATRSTASSTRTGFRTTDFMLPMGITGRAAQSLREAWADGPHAHLGITVPGFPSAVPDVRPEHEHQRRLDPLLPRGAGGLHPPGARARRRRGQRRRSRPARTATLQQRSTARPGRRATRGTATTDGRIVANWPGYMREYQASTRDFDPAEFIVR